MTELAPDPGQTARWKRRKDARPSEILDAALAVFAEKGFAGARMEDIAARAGVTKGTIYLYFENKEAVFKSLVRDSIGTTVQGVLDASAAFEGSAKELLRFVLKTMAHFLSTSDRVVLPKIILAESGNFPELLRFYREEIIDKGLGVFSNVMARGVASGEFRAIDPDHAARLAIA
ncbi:MAG TPA: TetR/AcrR family transcriptional regulator, partial [Rhizomicrobium sp.]|nr:TetR/AcrR family transcriptional regulator [Rhizomicrobium sp.]